MANNLSNSDATLNAKEEPKPVPAGETHVRAKKETFFHSLKREIISDESRSIGDYVLHDVLVPSFKRTIVDIVCMIFGDSRGGARRSTGSPNAARVSYSGYYTDKAAPKSPPPSVTNTLEYDFVYDDIGIATTVMTGLQDSVNTYHVATVNDLYDYAEITIPNPQSYKYGWTSLPELRVVPYDGGWVIQGLPKPKPVR